MSVKRQVDARRRIQAATETVVALLLFGAPTLAGDYHRGAELRCSNCHTIHFSEGGTAPTRAGPGGPYSHLLLNEISALCLSCHDGGDGSSGSPPDVYGAASYESATTKRSAGAFQGTIGEDTHNGHNLDSPGDVAPGSSPTLEFSSGLNCSTCHAVHGNDNYRNLDATVGNATAATVSYVIGSYDGLSSVRQWVLEPTKTHYATTNIEYRNNSLSDGTGHWCQSCHTFMHGAPGDTSTVGGPEPSAPYLRHPTMGVTMSDGVSHGRVDSQHWFSALASRVPVVSPSGSIPGSAVASDNEPFCGTCHKAHGSSHPFALVVDDSSTAALEDGATLKDLCQQCHLK